MTMTPSDEQPELLTATQTLAAQVRDLSEHLSVSQDQAARTERQAHRAKILARWMALVALVALGGVVFAGAAVVKVQDAVDVNRANAVTSCENANESRKANKILWDFLIDASMAQGTPVPPERAELLVEVRDFIAALYQPRDCSDLAREYPLPMPPPVS